ncbi:MAG TPA: tetratricopeptide repeat protein, partial [Candidatus Sulfopaludibacter sp.]|nr:tetratricopeptide repeat protein [Candidatus Sulfopaludibacter sp.]
MRLAVLFTVCGMAFAQAPDPAYEPLSRAYEALRTKDYDAAVAGFLKGIEAAPGRASIHKDLAYTYLKIGENELARGEFGRAMEIEPSDIQVAMEYAFLCYETKEQAQARRIFDRIRKTGNATAEQAFQNIDKPLAEGIERWRTAIGMGSDTFSAHFELARLAEQRDDLGLAAEHYEKAWRLLPDRRSVLVDLGRVWKAMNRTESAGAALLAASRGGEPRAAEMARELLPDRYPYVSEFRQAIELDPGCVELRRELAYLLLRMDKSADAEAEFAKITQIAPDDLLSATQLGFLLFARGDRAAAMPLFERVLAGNDEELANRVRAVLRMPQVLKGRPASPEPISNDAKLMAERSIKAGYLKDALKYLQVAHEADPGDFQVMLRLGWTYNILRQDQTAEQWFNLARKSPDFKIASEAEEAWRGLRPGLQQFRTSVWFYPLFSSRWHDVFSYAQSKTEMRTDLPLVPYASVRFVGDTRLATGINSPQNLSESSVILALGVRSVPWHRVTFWVEGGWALSYVNGHALPDYRGGFATSRGIGTTLAGERRGLFADTSIDGVFISRFGNDFLVYDQSRAGYTFGPQTLRGQIYWNANITLDIRSQYWANFGETGPGLRLRHSSMPPSMYVTLNLLRGAYLINAGNP